MQPKLREYTAASVLANTSILKACDVCMKVRVLKKRRAKNSHLANAANSHAQVRSTRQVQGRVGSRPKSIIGTGKAKCNLTHSTYTAQI